MTSHAAYSRRASAVSRGERRWEVETAALVSTSASGRERRWAWRDIVGVRLCFAPTRYKPWRHIFVLKPREGGKIVIDNCHYRGVADYEDRSSAYTPFVHAALARIAAENPKARALIGETPKRYFFYMLAALVALGAAAFALIAFPTPLDALPYAEAAKLALIVLMLPVFALLVVRALPRGAPLDSIPKRALPPVN